MLFSPYHNCNVPNFPHSKNFILNEFALDDFRAQVAPYGIGVVTDGKGKELEVHCEHLKTMRRDCNYCKTWGVEVTFIRV